MTTARNSPSEGSQESVKSTMPDVYMESVDSCEYDPDDLDLEEIWQKWLTPH